MKQITRSDWITALKSGDFLQTKGNMRRGTLDGSHAYCCLGVAGKIAGLEFTTPSNVDDMSSLVDDMGDTHEDSLPLKLETALDLGMNDVLTCVSMNDTYDFTFEEIAEVLEASDAAGVTVEEIFDYLRDNEGDLTNPPTA